MTTDGYCRASPDGGRKVSDDKSKPRWWTDDLTLQAGIQPKNQPADEHQRTAPMTDSNPGGVPRSIVVDLARELYDRFVMGGWEPQDAYGLIEDILNPVSAPTVKSIMDWSVGLNQSNGRPEVRFELTDEEEAKAWFQWLLDRCEDATDGL